MAAPDALGKLRRGVMKRLGVSAGYTDLLMTLVKQRLGILTDVKNTSIEARVFAALDALADTFGIAVDENNAEQLMLIVDMAAWEYQNAGSPAAMPMNLRFKLNNTLIREKGREDDVRQHNTPSARGEGKKRRRGDGGDGGG